MSSPRRRYAGVSHFQRPRHYDHGGIAVEEFLEACPYRAIPLFSAGELEGDNKAVAAATRRVCSSDDSASGMRPPMPNLRWVSTLANETRDQSASTDEPEPGRPAGQVGCA